MPVLVRRDGVREDLNGQRCDRLCDVRRPEAIVERGEEQRRGLARDARERDEDAGKNAGQRRRNDDAEHGAGSRCAERQRPFAKTGGNEAQQLFGRAHYDRDHEQAEGDAAGDRAESLHRKDDDAVGEDADDDRRHAVEHVGREADDRGEAR